MRRTRFDDAHCPIARATDLLADWWTPLVLREAFTGTRRFADFEADLSIPKAVLSARLTRLCADGVLRREKYQDNPERYEYRLTDKGRALWDVLAAMWRWGTDWCWPDGEGPVLALKSRATGDVVQPVVVDELTGERLDLRAVRIGRAPPRDPGRDRKSVRGEHAKRDEAAANGCGNVRWSTRPAGGVEKKVSRG